MDLKQIFLLLFSFMLLLCCAKDNSPLQVENKEIDTNVTLFPRSLKGWELYSWYQNDKWYYSIQVGTDRLKSYTEVSTHGLIVGGEKQLKQLLDHFQTAETITWIGRVWLETCWITGFGNLELPPVSIVTDIKNYCQMKGLILQIAD